jgi:hypothetical protein
MYSGDINQDPRHVSFHQPLLKVLFKSKKEWVLSGQTTHGLEGHSQDIFSVHFGPQKLGESGNSQEHELPGFHRM